MRRLDRARDRGRWHRQRHPLFTHRPWPPVAHSITPAALFSNAWTSEANRSSGRIPVEFADLIEKRLPATLADFFAEFELDSHDKALCWPNRGRLIVFADFLLFNTLRMVTAV
jgi:hypothetical protein